MRTVDRSNRQAGAPVLQVSHLSLDAPTAEGTRLQDISLELRAGEILGVGGVAGNGQEELLSALSGEGLEDLLLAVETRLAEVLDEPRDEAVLILPSDDGRRRAWLHRQGIVASEEMGDKGVRLLVRWTARQKAAYEAL